MAEETKDNEPPYSSNLFDEIISLKEKIYF